MTRLNLVRPTRRGLTVKKAVRSAEGLEEGDDVEVALEVVAA